MLYLDSLLRELFIITIRELNLTNNPTLYVVATPIGNVGDISARAIETLRSVDYIAAEDTRHSKVLLQHHGIDTPMFALHDHNEAKQVDYVLENLQAGRSIALISDAGTPLISDPGYVVVREAREQGFAVVALPGPSAVIAALSISGLPACPFSFLGFLPAKTQGRQGALEAIKGDERTTVFYESTHRIMAALTDIQQVLGEGRDIAVVKELTKKHENVLKGTASHVKQCLEQDTGLQKGEFVIIIKGLAKKEDDKSDIIDQHLRLFLPNLPMKQAVKFTVELTNTNKNRVYERALQLQKSE